MGEITSAAGIVLDTALGQVGTVASTVVSTPLLLFVAVCGVAFIGVTLFKRLLSVNM